MQQDIGAKKEFKIGDNVITYLPHPISLEDFWLPSDSQARCYHIWMCSVSIRYLIKFWFQYNVDTYKQSSVRRWDDLMSFWHTCEDESDDAVDESRRYCLIPKPCMKSASPEHLCSIADSSPKRVSRLTMHVRTQKLQRQFQRSRM